MSSSCLISSHWLVFIVKCCNKLFLIKIHEREEMILNKKMEKFRDF